MRELAALTVACVASVVIAVIALQLWDSPSLRLPIASESDGLFTLGIFKSIHDFGWIWSNHALGAPNGQQFYDFGTLGPDNLHWAMAWVLERFASQPGVVYNAILLVSFPLSAASAYAVLRWLSVSRLAAIAPAALFAVAPYHILRGEVGHLMLAETLAVPLGVFLAIAIATGIPLWRRRTGESPRLLRWSTWTSWRTIILCVLIASTGVYYAIFTILFVGVATVAAWLTTDHPKAVLLTAGAVLVALGAVLVFNLAPTVLYHQAHGANAATGQRSPNESLTYGLNLIGQVLPPPTHRLGVFGDLGNKFWGETTLTSEGPTWGGTLSVLGLLLLMASLMAAVVGGAGKRFVADPRLRATSLVALTAALLGATGAGGAFIAFILNPSIRAWNRIGIVLVFCGLLAAAVALDAIGRRMKERGPRASWAFAALVPVLLVLGGWDQTSSSMRPNYEGTAKTWTNDAHFVDAVSDRLGGKGEIYQIPYLPFPESPPVVNMFDYSPLKGYIHANKKLKWSYGAMKGRPADWQQEASGLPLPVQLRAAALAGFDGLWIDAAGYADVANEAVTPARITTGVEPIVSDDTRLYFFDLRPLRAKLQRQLPPAESQAVGPELTHPLATTFGVGFYPPESDAKHRWQWARAKSSIKLDNPDDQPRDVAFDARLSAGRRAAVQITLDGKPIGTAIATPLPGRKVDQVVRVPPGQHVLGLSTDAPRTVPSTADTRDLRLQVLDGQVNDEAILDLADVKP
ncbi:hypothetical protein DSM104299_05334 [Baekduia alba]|nr:hypothetical protein DSM104299_05334 [Baekduia alba]